MDSTFLLQFDAERTSSAEALAMLSELKAVQHAQPNVFYRQAAAKPPVWATTVDLAETWPLTKGLPEIKVAVIDTGIKRTHPEFASSRVEIKPGCDVVDCADVNPPEGVWSGDYQLRDDDPDDDQGHGTEMSALIVGKSCGLAPGCTLLPVVRALATAVSGMANDITNGFAKADDLARALRFAADSGAHVINMSYYNATTDGISTHGAERQAITYAIDHGCFFAAAMGNDGDAGSIAYPAAYPGVCAVAAVDDQYNRWPYSQTGPHCSLSAPGVDMISALLDGTCGPGMGTSQATAAVSASAAIVLSAFVAKGRPLPKGKQLASLLTGTAKSLSNATRSDTFGYGCVDIAAAIAAIPA
jgi:subtilisin family serine protease